MALRPLEGIRVIDFTSNVAAPFGTLALADLGADVIKVERPGAGDDARGYTPRVNGRSSSFVALNRGKRSVALDLRKPDGLKAARALIATADVVVESMRPGKMDAIGLGFDDVAQLADGLIYCALSGFGATGPDAQRRGYDMLIQARTGIMSITGERGGDPVRVGPSIVDIGSGIWLAVSVLAAVVKRMSDPDRAPQKLDVSLFDTGVAWMMIPMMQYAFTGKEPERMGGQTPLAMPCDIYPTSDGYVTVAILGDAVWKSFVEVIDRPGLNTPVLENNAGRVEQREELTAELRQLFVTRTTDEWIALLQPRGVTIEALRSPADLLQDPQALARGLVRHIDDEQFGTLPQIGMPFWNSGLEVPETFSPAPALGADSVSVLRSVGVGDEEIETLLSEGTLAVPEPQPDGVAP